MKYLSVIKIFPLDIVMFLGVFPAMVEYQRVNINITQSWFARNFKPYRPIVSGTVQQVSLKTVTRFQSSSRGEALARISRATESGYVEAALVLYGI